MISVCIATYNGSAYIDRQLRSILDQLGPSDEVVLVDDCSSDDTVKIIEAFGDSRIKIFRNVPNLGVIKTFERAIQQASGDVIFLSDQDDVWYPNKVAEFLNIFHSNPDVVLALSDAQLIDARGEVTGFSYFKERGRFSPSIPANILKNKYLGCTMAFRASVRPRILPFPADIPMHDMWIGCIGAFCGKVFYLDTPLMAYRRHGNNATPLFSQGDFLKMLAWRWKLVKNLFIRICN